MKLVTAEQMRVLERKAIEAGATTEAQMMEEAGVSAAQETMINLGSMDGRKILVLVGPGNNGGDGLAAARYMEEWNAEVFVYMLLPRTEDDPQYQRLKEAGIHALTVEEDPDFELLEGMLSKAHAVTDALLGTGTNRPIEGDMAEVLKRLAEARTRRPRPHLLAIDVPTGVHPDTGAADPLTVAVDITLALGFPKVGLYQLPGRGYAGEITRIDIGIPEELADELPYDEVAVRGLQPHMPARPLDSHKGDFGRAVIAAGSSRFPGAAVLAAQAATRGGAGLVVLATPAEVQPLLGQAPPEVIREPLPGADGAVSADAAPALLRALAGADALLLGPGLTHTPATSEFVAAVIAGLDAVEGLRAAVLDADALNALAELDGWHTRFDLPRVLTPHPGEMARLLRTTTDAVQAARLESARQYAEETRSVVVLKGAATVIVAPDGRASVSGYASSVLASGGTGDVLAGFIVSLIAQGMDPYHAAAAAVYMHSEAAKAVESQRGAATAIASDLFEPLGDVRKVLDGS